MAVLTKKWEALKAWGDKPLSMKAFARMVGFAALCFMAISLVCSVYDNDMYFLLATGRHIVQNGIPHVNPWSADQGMQVIVQQWLYDVLLYGVEQLGSIGFTLFLTVQFVLMAVLVWELFRVRGVDFKLYFLAFGIAAMFFQTYIFSIRPQLVSTVLLLWECLAVEKFLKDSKAWHLAALPVGIILEMNLHASIWPFHFCILAAYVFPSFYMKRGVDNGAAIAVWKKVWPVAVAGWLMVMALFASPYGVDNIRYVVMSVFSGTFDQVKVVEMQAPMFLSGTTAVVALLVALCAACWKLGCLSGFSLNMTVGFGAVFLLATRNHMFLVFPLIFLLRDLFLKLQNTDLGINWRKDVKNNLIPILLAADVLFAAGFMSSFGSIFGGDVDGKVPSMDRAVEYVSEHWDGSSNIFVGFDSGAYFEYKGLGNIYMDARPELFMKSLNGEKNVLSEYSTYVIYGDIIRNVSDGGPDEYKRFAVTRELMEDWLEGYDFQFICVAPGTERYLYGYMLGCTGYKKVEEASSSTLVVYEKSD